MNVTTGTELVTRETVEDLVAKRDVALSRYSDAFDALGTARDGIAFALKALTVISPGDNRYNFHLGQEKNEFHRALKLPERPDYIETARRIIDTDVWSFLIHLTNLELLMDKKAKDRFQQQLIDNPPEVTVENVYATLEQFRLDAGMIFKRGIAECFSDLDRRFRSHDGWKIGSRIILTRAFNEFGGWNYHRNHEATFIDVERVFRTLDGKKLGFCEIVARLREERQWGSAHQTTVETEYFTVRCFKNGNAHIWFKRDDLLEKVNQLLGDYYRAPIPEDREPDEDTGLHDPKTTIAKRYAFFPTPDPVADKLLHDFPLIRRVDEPQLTILEPSAGTGSLARRCLGSPRHDISDSYRDQYRFDHAVDCVEIHPDRALALRDEGVFRKVYVCDFLMLSPETTGLYDRVVMNPPFDRDRDVDHVFHALKFLKPDGVLAAIMSAGVEFRETKKAIHFRELMVSMKARWSDLPPASFASAGTYCNTVMLRVRKDGRQFYF